MPRSFRRGLVVQRTRQRAVVLSLRSRRVIMTDNVNKPPHYTAHPSGVECIQITEHMNFCLGNALKYIWRAGLKQNEVEDLKKAIWYLNREIERLENGKEERLGEPYSIEYRESDNPLESPRRLETNNKKRSLFNTEHFIQYGETL